MTATRSPSTLDRSCSDSGTRDDLTNEYTHNSRHHCSNRRPCHRLLECGFCRRRKKRYVIEQVAAHQKAWDLRQFVTISFVRRDDSTISGFELLYSVRKKLTPFIQRRSKYLLFSVVSEEINYADGSVRTIPHFHVLASGDLNRVQLRAFIVQRFPDSTFRLDSRPIPTLRRLVSYLMDVNYFRCLEIKPARFRIISSSRGILVGHPKWNVLKAALESNALEAAS